MECTQTQCFTFHPVSYTHLDVYKRQILIGAVTNTPALGAAQQTLKQMHIDAADPALGCAVTYPLGVVGVIPVSYTHLDVYKRQAS